MTDNDRLEKRKAYDEDSEEGSPPAYSPKCRISHPVVSDEYGASFIHHVPRSQTGGGGQEVVDDVVRDMQEMALSIATNNSSVKHEIENVEDVQRDGDTGQYTSTLGGYDPGPFSYRRILTNQGFMSILKTLDFRTRAGLRALRSIDSRAISRDISIFCDHKTFSNVDVDYVIRCGPTASYIEDHNGCEKQAPDVDMGCDDDLRGLRLLKLSYHLTDEVRKPEDQERLTRNLEEWKAETRPPQYAYDLGELCLHCRIGI
ncbi:hypothetical protein O1611_g3418 [Lasiodiplodia mahajangana]|uniref:Uncharacterized protein n=1 Tax=Lasiodiplodia mahajangana TaxID=1108764 RepID=A0ACC2JS76_9PEZI|nr:hypothetical protein O1611_g3418 [Lasiodiplodia mahajangana]